MIEQFGFFRIEDYELPGNDVIEQEPISAGVFERVPHQPV